MPDRSLIVAIVATLMVFAFLIRSLGARLQFKMSVSMADVRAISRELHERVGRYFESNYGGDPAQLPGAIRALLPIAREIAQQHGQSLDDGVLRLLIVTSVSAHHAATRAQVEAAFDAALRDDKSAA